VTRIMQVLVVTILLYGCTMECKLDSTAGRYAFSLSADKYELELRAEGDGMLLQNRKPLASLRWEIDEPSRQVFLNVDRQTLDVLRKLAGAAPPPPDAVRTERGYFAVSPRCDWHGRVTRLDMDEGGGRHFARIEGG
jgi:hypothetical protein